MKVQITITLPNGEQVEAWRDFSFSELKHNDPFRQIDYPTSGISAIFCTPKEQAEQIMYDRRKLADQLTRFIVDSLGSRDLVDGYPKRPAQPQEATR